MSISPCKSHVFNAANGTGTDKPTVAEGGKRIFFVTGEPGCGKSTFLAALMQKYALRPSGFITKKEEAVAEPALYIHQVMDGTTQFRYAADNRAGICRPAKAAGFAPAFDTFGVMCLKQAETAVLSSLDSEHADTDCSGAGCAETALQQSFLPVILMDELGVMEAEAEFFFSTVCALFFNPRYYVIGVVKPRGTRFLPVLEQMPEAVVFHLTLQNRSSLYAQLERAQSFVAFLDTVGMESPKW